jgi:hypothetical protein
MHAAVERSPNEHELKKLGFVQVSGPLSKPSLCRLNPETLKPEQKFEGERELIVGLVTFALLNASLADATKTTIFMHLGGIATVTGAYDHGHFWIADGLIGMPRDFVDIQTIIRFAAE